MLTTVRPAAQTLQGMLEGTSFVALLNADQRERVHRDAMSCGIPAGGHVCVNGRPIDHWIGVVDGMAKIENSSASGRTTTLGCAGPGSWFGEGSVLKGGCWPYDAVAMVDSTFALIPRSTFEWLLGECLPFNRFIIDHLNARLGQFIQRCEHLRLHQTDEHVAHCLAELFDPMLYPGTDSNLVISQEELSHLAGVSRPTANRVLHRLESAGLLSMAYGVITVCDIDGLRSFGDGD